MKCTDYSSCLSSRSSNDVNSETSQESDISTNSQQDWKQKGNEQFKDGNYKEAISMYLEAVKVCGSEDKVKCYR